MSDAGERGHFVSSCRVRIIYLRSDICTFRRIQDFETSFKSRQKYLQIRASAHAVI